MNKLITAIICIYIVKAVTPAFDINPNYDHDYFYEEEEDSPRTISERNSQKKEAVRQQICGDYFCTETIKKLTMDGNIPTLVFNTTCESCYDARTKQNASAASSRKEIYLFQKETERCYLPSKMWVNSGCRLCKNN